MKLRFDPVHGFARRRWTTGPSPVSLCWWPRTDRPFSRGFGARQLVPRLLPVFRDTLYDVASLTKAVVTSVLAMREVGARSPCARLPVAELLPEFEGADRARVTVRQLLSHAPGCRRTGPFWRQAATAASERRAISLLAAREPLEYPPGTRAVYSDLGFIVLGWLLERLSGARLDVLARKRIVAPLGLRRRRS